MLKLAGRVDIDNYGSQLHSEDSKTMVRRGNGQMSYLKASVVFGIPRSTLDRKVKRCKRSPNKRNLLLCNSNDLSLVSYAGANNSVKPKINISPSPQTSASKDLLTIPLKKESITAQTLPRSASTDDSLFSLCREKCVTKPVTMKVDRDTSFDLVRVECVKAEPVPEVESEVEEESDSASDPGLDTSGERERRSVPTWSYRAGCSMSTVSHRNNAEQQNSDDAEAALLRLQADKLVLEMEKLREERVRIAAERRNMALRVDITNLYKHLQSLAVPSNSKSAVLDAMQTISMTQSILKQRLYSVPTVMADSHLYSENSSNSEKSFVYSNIVDDKMGSVQSSISTIPSKSLTNTSFNDSVVSISSTDRTQASSKLHAPHLSTMVKRKKRRSAEVTVASPSLVEETCSRLLPETYASKVHSKTMDVLVTDDRHSVAQAYTSGNVPHSASSVTPANASGLLIVPPTTTAAPSRVLMTVKPIRPDRLIQTENNSSPQLLEELPVAYGDSPMQGSYASVPIFKTECNIEAVIPKLAADLISVSSAVVNTKHPGSDRKLTVHSFVSDRETVLNDIDVAGATQDCKILSNSSVAGPLRYVEREVRDQNFSLDLTEQMKCELNILEEIGHKPQCSYSIILGSAVKRKTLEGEIPSKRRRFDVLDDET